MVLEPLRPLLGRRLPGEAFVDLLDVIDLEVVERLGDRPAECEVAVAGKEDEAVAAR
jgi:hypothetical protein